MQLLLIKVNFHWKVKAAEDEAYKVTKVCTHCKSLFKRSQVYSVFRVGRNLAPGRDKARHSRCCVGKLTFPLCMENARLESWTAGEVRAMFSVERRSINDYPISIAAHAVWVFESVLRALICGTQIPLYSRRRSLLWKQAGCGKEDGNCVCAAC